MALSDAAQARLTVLVEAHRAEIIESYDVFLRGGESDKILSAPAWRREAVLEREAFMRGMKC